MGKTLIKRYWPASVGTISMVIDGCFCQKYVSFGARICQPSSSPLIKTVKSFIKKQSVSPEQALAI